ncbi:C4-dicarboxylate transport transcriptional regulatory protein DctD [Nymphon striatum]|nr:C4-dicarboxylate transport transcriptional regulatory protein DctD [Nymphon striatum]
MTQILIVDDEPLLREELQESLELEDYDVATAESVPDALVQCAETVFDVVVTDLKMPIQGGLELIRKLNEDAFPGIVVVVSGHGAESSREEAMAHGAVACFAKPLDIDELIDVIKENTDVS